MSTTFHFQVKQNYFSSAEECILSERKNINTNTRYKFFNQTHFTAGDEEQFNSYRDRTNGLNLNRIGDNLFSQKQLVYEWFKYKNLHPLSVDNTFNYMFQKFKKGIFLKIRKGKISVFLPFSNKNFINEWHKNIKIHPEDKDIYHFLEKIQKTEGRKFNRENVNKFTDRWYANNCLLRWEFPIHEGDTNVPIMADMFQTLVNEREIVDTEFFVNCRDFPLLKKDQTEPYNHLFGEGKKLLSHNYDKYSPILSMVSGEQFADIPIPTGDDWARVCRKEGKFFPKTANRDFVLKNIAWNEKKPTAVFRGASTGAGVTIETNPRLKLAYLSTITLPENGIPLLNAGITEWNLRPRKIEGNDYLQTIDLKKIPFELVKPLTPSEQCEFKYIINVDGHARAFRLSLEMESGSCILLAKSKYKLWFEDQIKPYKHYIPIREDLSDLIEKIRWCRKNDKQCLEIANRAKKFAETFLTKNGILDYLQKVLFELKSIGGTYFYTQDFREIRKREERKFLEKEKQEKKISSLPVFRRSFGYLSAIEELFNPEDIKRGDVIFSNKSTTISMCYFHHIPIIEKHSDRDLTHEAFVSLKGTNSLLKEIPNFSYVFAFNGDKIYSEYIKGETFGKYLSSEKFNLSDYIFILLQISLSICVAQKRIGFVHYDLTTWNIIIQELENEKTFDYVISYDKIFRIKTKMVPIIIDMGRSHIIYDDIHYGETNPFSFSKIQDILSILFVSLYEISKFNFKLEEVGKIITLANFISDTDFRNKKFTQSGTDGLGEIRFFFGNVKKYSQLVKQNKGNLEDKNCLYFINYILTHFPNDNVCLVDNLEYHNDYDIKSQIINFSIAENREEKINSYLKLLKKVKIKPFPFLFQNYYFIKKVLDIQEIVYKGLISFLQEESLEIDFEIDKKIKTQKRYFNTFLKEIKEDKDIEIDCFNIENKICYDENIFLFPERVLTLLEENKAVENTINTDLFYCLENIVVSKNLFYIDQESIKRYKDILKKGINNYRADIKTLCFYSEKIYSFNLEDILDNETTKEYKNKINQILKIKNEVF